MSAIYDVCIVGAGMIGSAAARHASTRSNLKVILVGPQEPKNRQGHSIFGAHYDEARVTRATASDPMWARLAQDSIARYRDLEQQSGIKFYNEVNTLTVGEMGGSFIEDTKRTIQKYNMPVSVLTAQQTRQHYPYLNMKQGCSSVLETKGCGWINPRKMVQAEQIIAEKNGCTIVREIVNNVQETTNYGQTIWHVTTEKGRTIKTKKVLLCTGAFTPFRDLIPGRKQPDIHYMAQAVVFAELSDNDLRTMRSMPSLLYHAGPMPSSTGLVNCEVYLLPPVQYPDGKWYVKIGHHTPCQFDRELHTASDVADWYTQPVPVHVQEGLKQILHIIFPDLQPLSYHTDSCVTTMTSPRRPYIDLIHPKMGVVLAGNGYAAKSCDQLAKLGVDLLVDNTWGYKEFPQCDFKCKWKHGTAKL